MYSLFSSWKGLIARQTSTTRTNSRASLSPKLPCPLSCVRPVFHHRKSTSHQLCGHEQIFWHCSLQQFWHSYQVRMWTRQTADLFGHETMAKAAITRWASPPESTDQSFSKIDGTDRPQSRNNFPASTCNCSALKGCCCFVQDWKDAIRLMKSIGVPGIVTLWCVTYRTCRLHSVDPTSCLRCLVNKSRPSLNGIRPATIFSSEDLPTPLGPITRYMSPGPTVKDMFWKRTTRSCFLSLVPSLRIKEWPILSNSNWSSSSFLKSEKQASFRAWICSRLLPRLDNKTGTCSAVSWAMDGNTTEDWSFLK